MPKDKAQDARRLARQLAALRDGVLAPLAADVPPQPSVAGWPLPPGAVGGGGNTSSSTSSAEAAPLLDWDALPRECDPAYAIHGGGRGGGGKKKKRKTSSGGDAGDAAATDTTATPAQQQRAAARAHRKRLQAESFARPLASLLGPPPGTPGLTVVDFGCGSGNLILPLAAAWRACRWVGVDMKPAPVRLLRARAAAAGLDNVAAYDQMIEAYQGPVDVALALHACGNATDRALQVAVRHRAAFAVAPCCVGKLKFSMAGGTSFHARLQRYTPQEAGARPADRLPVAAAIAAQQQQQQQQQQEVREGMGGSGGHNSVGGSSDGEGSDGEVAAAAGPPDSPTAEAASTHGLPPLEHPRSAWLRARLSDPERQFALLARVADAQQHAACTSGGDYAAGITDAPSSSQQQEQQQHLEQQQQQQQPSPAALRAELAAAAKALVEWDRAAAAAEAGYAAGLLRGLDADPELGKGDLIVGVPLPPPPPRRVPVGGGGGDERGGGGESSARGGKSGGGADARWREARAALEALCGPQLAVLAMSSA